MDKILIFGDSNTYGLDPETWIRYEEKDRYADIVKSRVKNYEIVIDGLCGRTTSFACNVPTGVAYECISDILKKVQPSYLFIMLGTNDLKKVNGYNEERLKEAMNKLLKRVYDLHMVKNVIIIVPPALGKDIDKKDYDFSSSAYGLSLKLKDIYLEVTEKYSYSLIDSNKYIRSGSDGEHFDKTSHHILADVLINYINNEL